METPNQGLEFRAQESRLDQGIMQGLGLQVRGFSI